MTIRVVVADDEPLARRGIVARLREWPEFEIVRECAGGRETIDAIRAVAPDLVFLDVQMPRVGGFDVVDAIGAEAMPPVVFITAFDQHALRAFEAQALDYLLKPIDDDRFRRTVERAARRVAERRAGADAKGAARLLIRERGRVELVDVEQISWIESRGDYVRLHGTGRNLLLRETMTALARRLDPDRFVRIHRSTIVNLARVADVAFHAERDSIVTLEDGTRRPVGRRFRAGLVERLARR